MTEAGDRIRALADSIDNFHDGTIESVLKALVARVEELENFVEGECTFRGEPAESGSYWFGSCAVVQARELMKEVSLTEIAEGLE